MNKALLAAAKAGNTADVLKHIAAGANINTRDGQGKTAVMLATVGNHPALVTALIKKGADLNIQDDRKDNPLLYAGAEGLLEIVKLTVQAGADTTITNRYGGTALIPAADRGHVEVVKELLTNSDVDIDHVNNLGWTALLEAVLLGDGGKNHQRIVELLIEHDADVNLADGDGVTPLAHAKERGYTEMENMLIKAGAK
ncbi:ankyrin repeat domain-containing protein [Paenibacillus sp. 481]|nr:ankyrin repeat domain-containing protein [Paenibacillus sp. 481]UHA75923.1 ankyrin repeat domain-containing protein [Paenibacillus sp. 481]